jgi:hypothetical protein
MTGEWAPGERRRAGLLATVVLGAVLYPLRQYGRPRKQRVDGFPLSWYPMFSARRCARARIHYVMGVRADGGRRPVHFDLLGPGGLNQVRRQLNRVVAEDRAAAFAADLAARLVDEPSAADLVRVEVMRGIFDLDRCMLERRFEGEETVLGGADLPGREIPVEVIPQDPALLGIPA